MTLIRTPEIIIAVLLAVTITLELRRRACFVRTLKLAARIKPERLAHLMAYADPDAVCAGPQFWKLSDGLRGTWQRFVEMTVLVRILQLQVHFGHIEASDAREAIRTAALQSLFSLRALPEALLCAVWKDAPHMAAMMAVRYHVAFSLRVSTLCSAQGYPEFV